MIDPRTVYMIKILPQKLKKGVFSVGHKGVTIGFPGGREARKIL